MDIIDEAQAFEERHRQEALAAHGAKAPPAGDWRRLSAKFCEVPDCGMPIPEERRRAIPGVKNCVDCQELIEQRQHQGRAR